MKFFIFVSLMGVIIQMNLCQKYIKKFPLVMLMKSEEIKVKLNDVSEKWIFIFKKMDYKELQNLCSAVLSAPFFVFEESYMETYKRMLERKEYELIFQVEKGYEIFPLFCSFGNSHLYLAKHSSHEGYIMYSDDHFTFNRVGVVTETYEYLYVTEKERMDIMKPVITWSSQRSVGLGDQSPLNSLNNFNKWKLCATFLLNFVEDLNSRETKNRTINVVATLMKYNFIFSPYLVECMECKTSVFYPFYIIQIPKEKDKVITASDDKFTVYKIRNLHSVNASSSSN